jgi:glyoxylase-like metal-dependent hydrolase (beta-lactamase superfamily II)
MELIPVDTHITAIDHQLLGVHGCGVCYVVRGADVALIETGTSLTVQQTLAGLDQLGVPREAVSHILCTHVHMDHAGGAGYLAAALPNALVYIHSMTVPHLVEPSRLMASVRRAVGETAWPLHGDCLPIAEERMRPAEELHLDLGQDVLLEAIATPGHSPDHLSFLERKSGGLFIGDAAGLHMPRLAVSLPVTPPPTYSLSDHQATITRLRGLAVSQMYLTHCGAFTNVAERLALAEEQLAALVEIVHTALERGESDTVALARRWLPFPDGEPGSLIAHTWSEMSINGMLRHQQRASGQRTERA